MEEETAYVILMRPNDTVDTSIPNENRPVYLKTLNLFIKIGDSATVNL